MKIYQNTKKSTTYNILKSLKKIINKEKYKFNKPKIFSSDFFFLRKALKSNQVSTYGSYTNLLENKIKNYTKSKYVICTNSGTSALHLALIANDIKKDDEVFIPAFNFVSSANAVKYCNAIPHFVEIEKETLGVDPIKLKEYIKKNFIFKNKKLINKKTKKLVKAIVLVYSYGHPPKIEDLLKICNFYKLTVIEDAAEALGSFYKDKHAGTFGKVGILSFNGNKIITSGAGGAIMTNDKKLHKRILDLATLGKKQNKVFDYKFVAYNYRMASINAALALSQIQNLDKMIILKRNIYRKYQNLFKKLNDCYIFKEPKYCKSNYWQNALFLKKNVIKSRNKIIKKLQLQNIDVTIGWRLLNEMEHFKNCPRSNLSQSKLISESMINLPSYK